MNPAPRRLRVLAVLMLSALVTCAQAGAQERASYPWDMPLEEIAAFDGMTYTCSAITVTFAEGYCAPIVIQLPGEGGQDEPAITGLEVLGQGTVRVEQGGEVLFEDEIHGAMFRFHPDDYEAFVTFEGKEALPDPGLRNLLLDMCSGSFRRFWHRGMEAFVPDPLIGAAYVYSSQHGGVMLWQNERELSGYCMDTKTELFKR
jgi:hypothetical protein